MRLHQRVYDFAETEIDVYKTSLSRARPLRLCNYRLRIAHSVYTELNSRNQIIFPGKLYVAIKVR